MIDLKKLSVFKPPSKSRGTPLYFVNGYDGHMIELIKKEAMIG